MTLESLLKPAKWVDEQLLIQYTKTTKKWESKGRSRYTLSNLVNIPSHLLNMSIGNLQILAFLSWENFWDDNLFKFYGRDFDVQESSSRVEDGNPIIKKIDRATRLPLFVTGIGFTGFGLYELVSGLWNGDNQNVSESLINISYGLPFIGVASSKYIKDANPKLLDKAPFWKTAYAWTKEKLSSLTPQPVPQPASVNYRQGLLTYV